VVSKYIYIHIHVHISLSYLLTYLSYLSIYLSYLSISLSYLLILSIYLLILSAYLSTQSNRIHLFYRSILYIDRSTYLSMYLSNLSIYIFIYLAINWWDTIRQWKSIPPSRCNSNWYGYEFWSVFQSHLPTNQPTNSSTNQPYHLYNSR